MPESSSSKSEKTEQSQVKNTSHRRKNKSKLPKTGQFTVKIDPVEHCQVTREMVLAQNTKLADHIAEYNDTKSTVRWQTGELLNMKVVRAWPIYAALAIEATAIVWLGAKLFGYA